MGPKHSRDEEISRLRSQLEVLQNEFNNFTYIVSHDFGAPLRAVTSFSKLLGEKFADKLDEKGLSYLNFVTEGGEKAQAMLAGLLQYSRLSTRPQSPESVELDLILGRCHSALKSKITACRAFIHREALPAIEADAGQLYQLFYALLDNALTYHKPHIPVQIRISAEDMDQVWKFKIEDNGIGIPASNQDHVFRIFKRLHRDEDYPGIGLGLALAKRVVERHGGTMGVTTSELGGTLCWFTLQKQSAEAVKYPAAKITNYG